MSYEHKDFLKSGVIQVKIKEEIDEVYRKAKAYDSIVGAYRVAQDILENPDDYNGDTEPIKVYAELDRSLNSTINRVKGDGR